MHSTRHRVLVFSSLVVGKHIAKYTIQVFNEAGIGSVLSRLILQLYDLCISLFVVCSFFKGGCYKAAEQSQTGRQPL